MRSPNPCLPVGEVELGAVDDPELRQGRGRRAGDDLLGAGVQRELLHAGLDACAVLHLRLELAEGRRRWHLDARPTRGGHQAHNDLGHGPGLAVPGDGHTKWPRQLSSDTLG